MHIRDSLFFSQLVVSLRSETATAELESLRAKFADPHFDQQRNILNPLGDEPVDVSASPTLELPDTVLFPDEFVQLTVSRTDPLLQLIAQAGAAVPQGDQPPIPIVKFRPAVVGQDDRPPSAVVRFRPGSSRSREDDRGPGAVCTIGTVSVNPRYDGDVSLDVLTCARVIGDQGTDDLPGRNPAYPVFGACADFPELRENFVKLIEQSPGLDAVPGSNLLDTLEAIDRVGREYDNCRERLAYDEPEGWDDDGHEAPERPIRFLDVAADFIAVSLIRRIPDLEVPFPSSRSGRPELDRLSDKTDPKTMAAALVSERTGRTVRVDVAMTGEITLSGHVLAVGGIRDKVLAARRDGVAQVILAKQNEGRVEDDLAENLRRGIGVQYVSTIDEALDLALSTPGARQKNG